MDKLTQTLGRSPRTIAIFRAIKLGDLLCAVPAFRALRNAFPDAHIALISLPWAKEFVASYPQYIDEFIAFPGWPGLPEQPLNPVNTVQFLQQMQERQWDVVIQMQGNGTLVNAMISLFGAKAIAGYYPPELRSEQWVAQNGLFQAYPVNRHEVHRHVDLMTFLGIEPQGYELEFEPSEMAQRNAQQLLSRMHLEPGRYVCLHPGGISGRRWPSHRFAEVADALARQGYTVALTGTSAEQSIVDAVRDQMTQHAVSLAGQTNLSSLGAVLQHTALLVSNDTGVAHLATACRTPSVIVFTSADPAEWGPLDQNRHRAIREEAANCIRLVIHEASELLNTYDRSGNSRFNGSIY